MWVINLFILSSTVPLSIPKGMKHSDSRTGLTPQMSPKEQSLLGGDH
jgi:hypothetical protein